MSLTCAAMVSSSGGDLRARPGKSLSPADYNKTFFRHARGPGPHVEHRITTEPPA